MLEAEVHFLSLHQDWQEYGSNNDFMISRVFFDLVVDTRWFRGLTADLKQVVGSDISEGVIEVSIPTGYDGPFNRTAFTDIATRYFMRCVGQGANGINLCKVSNIRMTNNVFDIPYSEAFEIEQTPKPTGGWR